MDTNIVSELRRPRAAAALVDWFDAQSASSLFLSIVTVGEIRQSVEQLRRRDPKQAGQLDRWLNGLTQFYEDRLLYVDRAVAEEWGRMRAKKSVPVTDALIAATARTHGLTIVTRNVKDFAGLGVEVLNPL